MSQQKTSRAKFRPTDGLGHVMEAAEAEATFQVAISLALSTHVIGEIDAVNSELAHLLTADCMIDRLHYHQVIEIFVILSGQKTLIRPTWCGGDDFLLPG